MSDFQFVPWSDNPNAPKIRYDLYLLEKVGFAGELIGSILYGTTHEIRNHMSGPSVLIIALFRSFQGCSSCCSSNV